LGATHDQRDHTLSILAPVLADPLALARATTALRRQCHGIRAEILANQERLHEKKTKY